MQMHIFHTFSASSNRSIADGGLSPEKLPMPSSIEADEVLIVLIVIMREDAIEPDLRDEARAREVGRRAGTPARGS